MMDWTTPEFRYLARLISRHAVLYTEMITTGALLHGDGPRFLAFDQAEHPVALQLGGSEHDALARCARLGERAGYDEINLNVGCPSDRVSTGRFGACLMAEPGRVADCVAAMKDAVDVPVTVKCRIGIDHLDSHAFLVDFVGMVGQAGCDLFIVHARKAWLQGLSPRQNRSIPPLRYDAVHRLKREFPGMPIIINGGLTDLAQAHAQLAHVDGVMVGREAYHNPYLLAGVDALFYRDTRPVLSREEVVHAFLPFVRARLETGMRLNAITRHMLGLFLGVPGARAWRRHLSEHAHLPDADEAVILHALASVQARQAPTDID